VLGIKIAQRFSQKTLFIIGVLLGTSTLLCNALSPESLHKIQFSFEKSKPILIAQYSGTETDCNTQGYHFSGILEAKNGNLISFYRLRPDEQVSDDFNLNEYYENNIGIKVSGDKGVTWSEEKYLSYGGTDGTVLQNGDIIVPSELHSWWVDEHALRTTCHRSSDNGITWTRNDSIFVRFPTTVSLLKRYHSRCHLHFWVSSMILVEDTVFATMQGQVNDVSHHVSILVKSTDNGFSWNFVSFIPNKKKVSHGGYYAASLIELDNGAFLSVLQTENAIPRRFVQSWSHDNGRTWTSPINALGIPTIDPRILTYTLPNNQNYSFSGALQHPKLAKLENGSLVLAFGRPGIQLAYNMDETGKFWDTVFTLVPENYELSYSTIGVSSHKPGIIVEKNGKLLIQYDIRQFKEREDDFPRNAVFLQEVTYNFQLKLD